MTKENRYFAASMMGESAHVNQKRFDGSDYFNHPIRVANLVKSVLGVDSDDDRVIAALLHDTLEDTSLTREEIDEEFGTKVASLVVELTKPPEMAKKDYILGLTHLSDDAKIIKLADRLDNVRDASNSNRKSWIRKYVDETYLLLETVRVSALNRAALHLKNSIFLELQELEKML